MILKKNKVLLSIIFSVLFMSFIGCNNTQYNHSINANREGNTTMNISNGAYVAMQDNWLFYSFDGGFLQRGKGLYCSNIDGSNKKKIISGNIDNINVVGDYIYFVESEENKEIKSGAVRKYSLYRTKLDGTNRTKLVDNCYFVNIVGNKIFYSIFMDDMKYWKSGIDNYPLKEKQGYIYTANIDGSNSKLLIEKNVKSYLLKGEFIYYLDEIGIYKVSIKTGESTEFVKREDIQGFTFDDNELYYQIHDCGKDETTITSVSLLDGSKEKEFIVPGQIITLVSCREKLIYIQGNFTVYSILKDGNKNTKISDGALNLYVFGEKIFLWNDSHKIEVISIN
jgi:hypothetical protein